jgi:hypothetical protein
MLGIDPIKFLKIRDPWLRSLYQAVASAAREIRRRDDHARARILGETLFGKK